MWFGLFGQGAISKCRPYDRSRAGVAYVTKCLGKENWGANQYEVKKFNLADTVTLSRSVFRVIRSLDGWGQTLQRARVSKDGPAMSGSLGSAGLDQPALCKQRAGRKRFRGGLKRGGGVSFH